MRSPQVLHGRLAEYLFAALLLPLMVLLSRHFGVTWDEPLQHQYGELVYRYFASGFQDRSAFAFKNTYLYGGMFDLICEIASRWVSTNLYVVRHLITSVFGWICVVYTGRLAKHFGGSAVGLLAMTMLVLSPRYFGHSMNNSKDIPFAAMAAMATYYLAQGRASYPYFSLRNAVKVTLAIALVINVRAGGILFLAYLAVLLAVFVVLDPQRSVTRAGSTAVRGVLIGTAALCLGTAFWPWAQVAPLTRPFTALSELTHFPFNGSVLYQGRLFDLTKETLPWHYPFVYLAISTPPVVLVGATLSARLLGTRGWPARGTLACWALVLFPIVYVIVRHSTLYDGIRHLLFVYPPLVAVSAIGWSTLVSARRPVRLAATLALTIGLAEPLVFQWRNHPNQVVYFNAFVGGPAGASGRYEMDYWGNSLLQATEWSAQLAKRTSRPIVLSSGAEDPFDAIGDDADRFENLRFVMPDRGRSELRIELLRAGNMSALLQMPAAHVVRMADGAPLCVVLPGPRYDNLARRLP